MKKLILVSLIGLASSGAMAAALCTGDTGGAKTVAAGAAGTNFNVQAINFRCSQNVFLDYADSATAMGVGSGSAKGKTAYQGNTASGSVTAVTTSCPATGCTATQTAAAATAALTAATTTTTSSGTGTSAGTGTTSGSGT